MSVPGVGPRQPGRITGQVNISGANYTKEVVADPSGNYLRYTGPRGTSFILYKRDGNWVAQRSENMTDKQAEALIRSLGYSTSPDAKWATPAPGRTDNFISLDPSNEGKIKDELAAPPTKESPVPARAADAGKPQGAGGSLRVTGGGDQVVLSTPARKITETSVAVTGNGKEQPDLKFVGKNDRGKTIFTITFAGQKGNGRAIITTTEPNDQQSKNAAIEFLNNNDYRLDQGNPRFRGDTESEYHIDRDPQLYFARQMNADDSADEAKMAAIIRQPFPAPAAGKEPPSVMAAAVPQPGAAVAPSSIAVPPPVRLTPNQPIPPQAAYVEVNLTDDRFKPNQPGSDWRPVGNADINRGTVVLERVSANVTGNYTPLEPGQPIPEFSKSIYLRSTDTRVLPEGSKENTALSQGGWKAIDLPSRAEGTYTPIDWNARPVRSSEGAAVPTSSIGSGGGRSGQIIGQMQLDGYLDLTTSANKGQLNSLLRGTRENFIKNFSLNISPPLSDEEKGDIYDVRKNPAFGYQ